MRKKLKDKFLLISISVFIMSFGFLIYFYLRKNLLEKWADFGIVNIAYLILLLYGALKFEGFRHISKTKLLAFQSIFYILTVGAAYLVFRYELLPMPKSFHVYTIGIVILAISSVVLLDYLVKRIEFFRDDKKQNLRMKSTSVK